MRAGDATGPDDPHPDACALDHAYSSVPPAIGCGSMATRPARAGRPIRGIDERGEIEREVDVLGGARAVGDMGQPLLERRRPVVGDRDLVPLPLGPPRRKTDHEPRLGRSVQQAAGRAVDLDRERRCGVDEARLGDPERAAPVAQDGHGVVVDRATGHPSVLGRDALRHPAEEQPREVQRMTAEVDQRAAPRVVGIEEPGGQPLPADRAVVRQPDADLGHDRRGGRTRGSPGSRACSHG